MLASAASDTPIGSESGSEMAHTLQGIGSPGALLQIVVDSNAAFGVSNIRYTEGEEIGPGEWVIRERFTGDFEPFTEYCAFTGGMLAMLPRLFGLPAGEVVEEKCSCDGASTCSFRVRWQTKGDVTQERNYFETRAKLLEASLETLQHTVAALVSAPSPDIGLERILAAAARAMYAPSYLLVVESPSSVKSRMLSIGLEPGEAERIARELPHQADTEVPGRVVVRVASTRQHYGWLSAVDTGNRRFLQREREVVSSYAGLAAAALDSATALEEAHRQAATTGTLLDLSKSLASVLSTEDMASVLAQAAPNVVDCDRSIVLLVDSGTDDTRIAATHGYPVEAEERLQGTSISCTIGLHMQPNVAFYDASELAALNERYGLSIGEDSVAMASVPMIVNGETIGGLIVTVTEDADRLHESVSLSDVLRGLSGQGAMAICNARLVDQIRHQALHDGLTGLPNRMLVLDRVEQALAKARREGDSVGTMFIDLDGFKDINDSLGHAAGDQLLTVMAARLQSVVRQGDTIGRLGGDEFVAIFEGPSLIGGPEAVAQRILDVVREPFELDEFSGKRLSVTASVGVAIGDRPTAGDLLRDADIALYQAKLNGKNCHVLFHPDMAAAARHLLEIGGLSTVDEGSATGLDVQPLEV